MVGNKTLLVLIILLVSSCEKEDMSKYDKLVDKYRKETIHKETKEPIKKKRRWKLRFIRRNRDTTTHCK